MKTILASLLIFATFYGYAECKCNCNPGNKQICASNYDLDKPCRGVCEGSVGFAPQIAACPMVLVEHPWTHLKQWVSVCVDRVY